MFTAELLTIVIQKQAKCPLMDEWIEKMWLSMYNGILFSHKKE